MVCGLLDALCVFQYSEKPDAARGEALGVPQPDDEDQRCVESQQGFNQGQPCDRSAPYQSHVYLSQLRVGPT